MSRNPDPFFFGVRSGSVFNEYGSAIMLSRHLDENYTLNVDVVLGQTIKNLSVKMSRTTIIILRKNPQLQNQYQVHVDVTLLGQNNATETGYHTKSRFHNR